LQTESRNNQVHGSRFLDEPKETMDGINVIEIKEGEI